MGMVLLAPACVKNRFKSLSSAAPVGLVRIEQQKFVVGGSVVSPTESVHYFGIDLPSYGYQPIYLQLQNLTATRYVLAPSSIQHPLVSFEEIMPYCTYKTAEFVGTTGSAALLFFWPLLPLYVIPVGLSMRSYNGSAEEQLTDYGFYGTSRPLEIMPYSAVHRFIFVEKHKGPYAFDLLLLDEGSKEFIRFSLAL